MMYAMQQLLKMIEFLKYSDYIYIFSLYSSWAISETRSNGTIIGVGIIVLSIRWFRHITQMSRGIKLKVLTFQE